MPTKLRHEKIVPMKTLKMEIVEYNQSIIIEPFLLASRVGRYFFRHIQIAAMATTKNSTMANEITAMPAVDHSGNAVDVALPAV